MPVHLSVAAQADASPSARAAAPVRVALVLTEEVRIAPSPQTPFALVAGTAADGRRSETTRVSAAVEAAARTVAATMRYACTGAGSSPCAGSAAN